MKMIRQTVSIVMSCIQHQHNPGLSVKVPARMESPVLYWTNCN